MTWTQIKDFPGYEISRDGLVRSWVGRGRHRDKEAAKAHEVTPIWLPSNRWAVRLVRDQKRHLRCVANLVLETFVGPPPAQGIGHLKNVADVVFADGDPSNISLSNLSWKTL